MAMHILPKAIAAASILMTAQWTTGCGGVGGSKKEGGTDLYAESAQGYFEKGYALGARDALEGLTNSYGRHLQSFDSPFVVQFASGYKRGYGSYSR